MRNIRFFDYCAGLGAFRTGFNHAGGYEAVGWCEIDKTAQTAYRALYQTEGEFFHDDATTLDPNDIPDFDILVGGIPCQSWSAAGLRRGFDDERGQLFFEYARILETRKPPLFILENVPRLVTANCGEPYRQILSHLHELGYGVNHVKMVMDKANSLLAKQKSDLIGYELYILLLSIHFHDLGNILGRSEHEKKIDEVIEKLGESLPLDMVEKSFVSAIAMAHGGYNWRETLFDVWEDS